MVGVGNTVRKSEAERKRELVLAAIREVGASGTVEVSVGRIARSAGVSPGLAFHYFRDKDGLLLAAMGHILTVYAVEVRAAVARAETPLARAEAVVTASFGAASFERHAIAAWINFYALALRSAEAKRLLRVYQRRLHSTLSFHLRPVAGPAAPGIAARIGGLIDGLYLRYALDPDAGSGPEGARQVLRALEAELSLLPVRATQTKEPT